jgi:hypothetical protein
MRFIQKVISNNIFALLLSCMTVCNVSAEQVQKELQDLKQKFISCASNDKKADYEKGIEYVANSGILDSAIQVGDQASCF